VLPAVGNTVDIAAANWSNTIGAPEPGSVWSDPDLPAGHSDFSMRACSKFRRHAGLFMTHSALVWIFPQAP